MLPSHLGLLPRLAALIEDMQHRAERLGIQTAIARDGTLRTDAKQWDLFKQGRKQLPDGRWIPVDPKTRAGIVTNATPSKAPHCAHVDHDGTVGAAACDVWVVLHEKPALRPKDPGYSLYAELGRIGEALGLGWGGRFTGLADVDHFEIPDFRELLTPAEAKALAIPLPEIA